MKVKIIKSTKDYSWYRDRIGCIFEVIEDEINALCYRTKDAHNCILKVDTIPVHEIKYECNINGFFNPYCIHENCRIASLACKYCDYNCGIDIINKTVQCSWEEKERNKMKRLNVREVYNDDSIIVIPKEHEDECALISMYNAHRNGTTDIRVVDKFTTITQANAILKVMGLNYELYEATDWSKVEKGAKVKYWTVGGDLKGLVTATSHSY